MRPGQLEPNDFELAILERIALEHPSLRARLSKLHVLSREFTGVGSFTTFRVDQSVPEDSEHFGLSALISVPGVAHGLGAVLFCRSGHPSCLEIHAFGESLWDGVYAGFSIHTAV